MIFIYKIDCDSGQNPKLKLHNFNANIALYKKRIKDLNRRFQIADSNQKCPDHLLAIGLNITFFLNTKTLRLIGDFENRANIRKIAKNVYNFTHNFKPTQEAYNQLNPYEKFLACDYIIDTTQSILETGEKLNVSKIHELKSYQAKTAVMDKFADISFASIPLGQYCHMQYKQLQRQKHRIDSSMKTSSLIRRTPPL